MEIISTWFFNFLNGNGVSTEIAHVANFFFLLITTVVLAWVIDRIVKLIVLRTIVRLIQLSKTTYDDFFVERKFFDYVSHLVPAMVIYHYAPTVFVKFPKLLPVVELATQLYFVVIGTFIVKSFFHSIGDILNAIPRLKNKPVKSFVQLANVINYSVFAIIGISLIMGKSPLVLFSALGAATAILLLIFKDTILGLVASVQLSVNDMVRVGDWISMEKYGADGDVIEINLTTIKVKNWDNTITTVPPYALVADSFKNWRGMSDSGGRRIKRSINIKMSSVYFCDEQKLEQFKKIQLVTSYIQEKQKEIEDYNQKIQADKTHRINGRNFTNLGIFRKYAEKYIQLNPNINQDLTVMVRQLQPTEFGIPVEIYCFSKDKRWVYYEGIMADIFDHLIAAVKDFELELFEVPTGKDFASFTAKQLS